MLDVLDILRPRGFVIATRTFLAACVFALIAFTPITAGATTSAIQRGGTLTVALVGSAPVGLDPYGPSNAAGSGYDILFDPLFFPNTATGGVYPGLALSYKTSNAAKTITFTLRPGVKFADGTPFNADAFVFNVRRSVDPNQNSECIAVLPNFKSVQALGEYKVEVNFTRPDPAYISDISVLQCGMMASPTAVMSEGTAGFALHPVGTGPFQVSSWNSGTEEYYVANPYYWQKGYPLVHALNVIQFGTSQAADACVLSGQCQLYEAPGITDIDQYALSSGIKFTRAVDTSYSIQIWLQLSDAPFNNYNARLAIAEATNPQALINSPLLKASNGLPFALPALSVIPKASWAYPGKTPNLPTYDPTKAAALVSSLGGLSFALNLAATPAQESLGAALQAQWEAVGMKVTLNPLGTNFLTVQHAKEFQATLLSANVPAPPADPDTIIERDFLSTSPLSQDSLDDPTMDALIFKSEDTFNHAARTADYAKVAEQFATDLPWILLYDNVEYWMSNSSFHRVGVPWNLKGTVNEWMYVP